MKKKQERPASTVSGLRLPVFRCQPCRGRQGVEIREDNGRGSGSRVARVCGASSAESVTRRVRCARERRSGRVGRISSSCFLPHFAAATPCTSPAAALLVAPSLTPSLLHSFTPSLLHSLTPSLPSSLQPPLPSLPPLLTTPLLQRGACVCANRLHALLPHTHSLTHSLTHTL